MKSADAESEAKVTSAVAQAAAAEPDGDDMCKSPDLASETIDEDAAALRREVGMLRAQLMQAEAARTMLRCEFALAAACLDGDDGNDASIHTDES